MQPCMANADADRQQGRVGQLALAAMGAAVRVGVGMSSVEELDQNDVENGALGVEARQPANPLSQIRLLLKKASPAGSFGRSAPNPSGNRLSFKGKSDIGFNRAD
jgi:hypothetical protein